MYEVILDDCDGARMTIHVFEDGSSSLISGTRKSPSARKRLLQLWHDPEAPDFVIKWATKHGYKPINTTN